MVLVTEGRNPDAGDLSNGERSTYAEQPGSSHWTQSSGVPSPPFIQSGRIPGRSDDSSLYLVTKGSGNGTDY